MTATEARGVLAEVLSLPHAQDADYTLGPKLGDGHLARARTGEPALVIPLQAPPRALAQSAGGFVLKPAAAVRFDLSGTTWTSPAAILEARDVGLLDAFAVLATDVAERSQADCGFPKWADIAAVVAEWHTLFSRARRLSPEQELGLWGELHLILLSASCDRLLQAWRGPEKAPWDFLLGGVSVEVKTSRIRLTHYVGQEQVEHLVDDSDAYFLSLWAVEDPEKGRDLPSLVDELLQRSEDTPHALMRVMETGYSPSDRALYVRRFLAPQGPAWFEAQCIPRVRKADAGVSHLRYMVHLDETSKLAGAREARLEDLLGLSSNSITREDVK